MLFLFAKIEGFLHCHTDLSFTLTSLFKIQGCKFHTQVKIFHEVQHIMTEITVKV